MRVLPLLLGVVVIAGLAGCSYQPARIGTEPAVIIDDGGWHDRDHHGGDNKRWEHEKKQRKEAEKRWKEERKRREKERKHWEKQHKH
ncbi:hypothetical protein FZZ93_02240 [Halomonas eurihalina]|uniref:Lipoprotein n=1 Tax=Halomonas eurihalina TaxID=42566 RepID=A0A5D9DC63_HALER|nr:hypothetical protein [Halomonas eurihalina]MDR5857985.1 hypothetical protein [Halomonas eurihalina]TZG41504.1 hypothetical protein FZZ93_02240 [Halomonas eurihalina]